MQDIGQMSLKEIYVMEAVVVIGLVVLEIPTGALADYIGRQKSIVIGSLFLLANLILYSFAETSHDIWIANIVWVIGFSFVSGAVDALLYDTLKKLGRAEENRKIMAHAMGNRLLLVAVASLFSGVLYEIDSRLPLWVSVPGLITALIVAWCMIDPPRNNGVGGIITESLRLMSSGIHYVRHSREAQWIIGLSTFLVLF